MIWLWVGSGLMCFTALTHCVVGERKLITPLLKSDHRLTTTLLPRRLIRFAWHLTGALMLVCGALVAWPGAPRALVILTGTTWLLAGLTDLLMTHGKHIGWPLLTLAGISTLTGILA